MSWKREFHKPLKVKDGRTLRTLIDAAEFMLTLPHYRNHRVEWQRAAEVVMAAAKTGRGIFDAYSAVRFALIHDMMMDFGAD